MAIDIFRMLVEAINEAFGEPYQARERREETAPLEVSMDELYSGVNHWLGFFMALPLTLILKLIHWEEEKPKRKNDELDPEPVRLSSHFELGDDGELIEVFEDDEKPKRRED